MSDLNICDYPEIRSINKSWSWLKDDETKIHLQTLGFVDAALEVPGVEGVLDVEELIHFSAGRHLKTLFWVLYKKIGKILKRFVTNKTFKA